jgi:hypothetical protein
MTGPLPLDALSDAIGELLPDGAILPRNEAMRGLLAQVGESRLAVLLPEASLRESLLSGDPVTVELDTATVELRCADGWLVGVSIARAVRGELAYRRALALAGAAGSIAHDLANLFGAAFGIADTLGDAVQTESDRRLLEGLAEGVRRGSQLTTAIERQLRAPSRRRAVAEVGEVVESVAAMLGKVVQHKSLAIELQVASGLPAIRADGVELKQLLLHCAFLAIELGAKCLSIRAAREPSSGGRPSVSLVLLAEGCTVSAGVVASAAAAVNLARGSLSASESVSDPARDAGLAVLTLRRRGVESSAAADGSSLSVALRLPSRAK